jgi:hypothetical protein
MKIALTSTPIRYGSLFLAMLSANILAAQAEPLPEAAVFGASVAEIKAGLEGNCTKLSVQPIEPVQIPGVSEQVQLDCEGFDYFGAPRKAEFVFGDDALTFIWVLVGASETDDLIASFKETYGAPSHETADFTAFADGNAAVRTDTPEALYYAPAVADAYRGWFDQQADGG